MIGDVPLLSTDPSKLDLDFVHHYLSQRAYWSKGRSKRDVQTSVENSLCFGLYTKQGNRSAGFPALYTKQGNRQIGFARVATDYVVFAWIMDVFIADEFKGRGYGTMLVENIINHPKLKEVNGFGLRTSDAHGLYKKFGFAEIPNPETWMFKRNTKNEV